jgi:hypothetical protein
MRELKSAELQAVSGGRQVPAPRVPTRLFGIRLSKADQRALAFVFSLFLRPAPER